MNKKFKITNERFHLRYPSIALSNTQGVFWLNLCKFSFLFRSTTLSFRFTGMLKIVIGQGLVQSNYAEFLTDQHKSQHNYLDVFASETDWFLETQIVISVLLKKTLNSVEKIYKNVTNAGIVDIEKKGITKNFETEMNSVTNV